MAKSVKDYGFYLFCKSDVNRKFLKKYEINMTVKQFQELLKKQPYKVVLVGGKTDRGTQYKHVKAYSIYTVKNNLGG